MEKIKSDQNIGEIEGRGKVVDPKSSYLGKISPKMFSKLGWKEKDNEKDESPSDH